MRSAVFNLGVYKAFLTFDPSPMLCVRIMCAVESAEFLNGWDNIISNPRNIKVPKMSELQTDRLPSGSFPSSSSASWLPFLSTV